ncbi:hypothetical protein J6590_104654, partial [Homalodisca vitripennis]
GKLDVLTALGQEHSEWCSLRLQINDSKRVCEAKKFSISGKEDITSDRQKERKKRKNFHKK